MTPRQTKDIEHNLKPSVKRLSLSINVEFNDYIHFALRRPCIIRSWSLDSAGRGWKAGREDSGEYGRQQQCDCDVMKHSNIIT